MGFKRTALIPIFYNKHTRHQENILIKTMLLTITIQLPVFTSGITAD